MEVFLLFRLLIGFGVAFTVAETIASLFWLPFYFRWGIQLYHQEIPGHLEPHRSLNDVASCSNTGFLFQPLATELVAFREPLMNFAFRCAPVMHGMVLYDGSKVQISGLANWAPLIVGTLFLLFGTVGIVEIGFFSLDGLSTVVLPVVFMVLWASAFQSQRVRLNDLADELRANLTIIHPKSFDSRESVAGSTQR